MTNTQFIQQLTEIRNALRNNDQAAVTNLVPSLVDAMDQFELTEQQRHAVASQQHIRQNVDEESIESSREFGVQKIRVSMFREQIFAEILGYITEENHNANTAQQIATHVNRLVTAEETFAEQETDIGPRLDRERPNQPELAISRVTQSRVLEPSAESAKLEVTVRNLGTSPGSALLITRSIDSVSIESPVQQTPDVPSESDITITLPFTMDELLSSTVEVFLADPADESFVELSPTAQDEFIAKRSLDSFDYPLEVIAHEEDRAPPAIERGVRDSFTDPRDRDDYTTIGITAGGMFTAAGYTAYQKLMTDDDDIESEDGDIDK